MKRHRTRRLPWFSRVAPAAGVLAFCGLAGAALIWSDEGPFQPGAPALAHATQRIATQVSSLRGDPLLDRLVDDGAIDEPPADESLSVPEDDPGQSASPGSSDVAAEASGAQDGANAASFSETPASEGPPLPPAQPAPVPPGADAGATEPEPEPNPEPEPEPDPPAEQCGPVTCGSGEVCCNASCGTCVPEGETCDTKPCEPRIQIPRGPVSMRCGQNTCNVGEVCCNASCGTCVPAGQSCDDTPCATRIQTPEVAVSAMCGQNTCSVGEVCCNPTCGTCVTAGQSCDETPCTPRIRYW